MGGGLRRPASLKGERGGSLGQGRVDTWGCLMVQRPFGKSYLCVGCELRDEGGSRGKPGALPGPREPVRSAPLPAKGPGNLGRGWGLWGFPA